MNERNAAAPRVGVAIVSYNSARVLPDCLASLCAQVDVQLRTVVVDNGSTDDTPALVRRDFPAVLLVEAPCNGGFSYGTNLGLRALGLLGPRGAAEEVALRAARSPTTAPSTAAGAVSDVTDTVWPADYVLFLNPDTVLPPEALARLTALLAARRDLGAVGPRLVRADGSLDRACKRGLPTAWNALCHVAGLADRWPTARWLGGYNLTYLPADRPAPVEALAGAFMLVPARVARAVGAWDERFFAYGEDLDYCLRVQRLGWGVWYEPSVRVLHLKGAASQQRSLPMLREFYRAMLLYYRKHHAPRQPWPLQVLVELGVRALYLLQLLRQLARPAGQRWVGAARGVARG